ncbi:hypothetical protein GCM10012285_26150 [Streptomyces kronopolitis]|uniref:Uncharacterized protein n=1 Tax=Streptomyces kronopolitis TaxID=1612435 RepID=A0ABQ2JFF2_9ACTN|nr:hypothetical protein GCM10012285_26150 [Streptomyces kronopolitis]
MIVLVGDARDRVARLSVDSWLRILSRGGLVESDRGRNVWPPLGVFGGPDGDLVLAFVTVCQFQFDVFLVFLVFV